MPRLRNKVLPAKGNDSMLNESGKKKSRKSIVTENYDQDSFNLSKIESANMLSSESSIEFTSLPSTDEGNLMIENSSNDDEISTKPKKFSRRNRKGKSSRNADSEESEKENSKTRQQTLRRKSGKQIVEDVIDTRRKSRRKSVRICNDLTDDDEQTSKRRQLRTRSKLTVDDVCSELDNSKKLSTSDKENNSRKNKKKSNSDDKKSEAVKTPDTNIKESINNENESISKRKARPSTLAESNIQQEKIDSEGLGLENTKEKSIQKNSHSTSFSKVGAEQLNQRRGNEDLDGSTYLNAGFANKESTETIEKRITRKSKIGRRSTTIHDVTIEKDLITDDESGKSEKDQITVVVTPEKNTEKPFEKNFDVTFSPKTPKLKYKNPFTPVSVSARSTRQSKCLAATPSAAQILKPLDIKKRTPKNQIGPKTDHAVSLVDEVGKLLNEPKQNNSGLENDSIRKSNRSDNISLDKSIDPNISTSNKDSLEPTGTRTRRKSDRIHDINIAEETIDLITDDECENLVKSQETANVHTFSPEKNIENPSEKKSDATFSPKSPIFKYDGTTTPKNSPLSVKKGIRQSKYLTSTPSLVQMVKPLNRTPKNQFLNKTVGNCSTVDLTGFTPRSIIKTTMRRSFQSAQKKLEDSRKETAHITTRKRRSISQPDLDTSTKKSRVTFHPNTSVFQIDSLESSVDSEISYGEHAKENGSRKSIECTLNPLNDTYEMELFSEQLETPGEGDRLPRMSSTPEIAGVHKLNVTFSPECTPKKITPQKGPKKVSKMQVQLLSTETSGTKRKVYKKTPKRLVASTNSSKLRQLNNSIKYSSKKSNVESNIQKTPVKVNESINLKQNKSTILSSLKKTPGEKNKNPSPKRGTSTKKMPDFASIHKRNFDKMESLVENVKKRADRAKQLFAVVPETGAKPNSSIVSKPKPTKLPIPVFKFVSQTAAKSPKPSTPKQNVLKPVNRFGGNIPKAAVAKELKETLKEEMKNKQPIRSAGVIKQKERQYVRGVRSNRRFDLLMKSRDVN